MKMTRVSIAALEVAGMLLGSLVAAGSVSASGRPAAKTHKVGVVLDVGGVNDHSFNEGSWDGAVDAENGAPGFKRIPGVKAKYISTPTSEDNNTQYYESELRQFASKKYNLTVAVGFAMENAIWHVAKSYPKLKFAIVDGWPTNDQGNQANLPNVANLQFEAEQSGYLVGYLAGLLDKNKKAPHDKNVIGMLGGVDYPTVTGYMCGYIEGAHYADKKIKVISGFNSDSTNPFGDAGAAKTDGNDEIGLGANILFQVDGGAGTGFMQAANERGDYAIGVDVPQGYMGKYIITSALKGLSQAVYLSISRLAKGTFKGGTNYFSLKNKGTGFDTKYLHHIPRSYVNMANAVANKIKSGKIKIAGPNPWDKPMTDYGKGKCKPDTAASF
jgi:basic membrane protein A